jgi:hypothetical protein
MASAHFRFPFHPYLVTYFSTPHTHHMTLPFNPGSREGTLVVLQSLELRSWVGTLPASGGS